MNAKPGVINIIVVMLVGAAAGICNGMIGCGGGIVVVYALSRLYKNDPERTPRDIFASAVASILPISAVSVIMYTADGTDPAGVTRYIIPAVTGGILGAYLLDRIKLGLLRKLFAILVMWAGLSMILRRAGVM